MSWITDTAEDVHTDPLENTLCVSEFPLSEVTQVWMIWSVRAEGLHVCLNVSMYVCHLSTLTVYMFIKKHILHVYIYLLCVCVYMYVSAFLLLSLAAEFPQSIGLHWGLIVSLLGLRDGLF